MARLSDIRLADWLEQVADGLNSGMEPGNAVALARALPGGASERIQASLKEGLTWGEALAQSHSDISDPELAIIDASSMAGKLPEAMRRIAIGRRDTAKTKRKIRLALAYPLVLVHFAAVVFSITYLVNGDVSSFLVSAGMVVVPIWLLIAAGIAFSRIWPEGAKGVLRRMPLFASYLRFREAAVLCEVLGSCFAAGMDVRDAWAVAVRAAGSPKLDRLGDAVLQEVANGRKASTGIEAFQKSMPKGFLQVYRSGEETGSLDSNLEAAAARYQTDAGNKLMLASMLYPKLLLIVVFGYVGYKIVSMVSNYYEELMKIAV